VRPPAPGEIGLGQDRELHAVGPQHGAALERRHHHVGRHAVGGQPLAQPVGGPLAVGAHHDAEPVVLQAHQPLDQAGAVADDGVPSRGLHLRRIGAVGDVDHVPHRRLGVREQPVEVEVEAREAVVVGGGVGGTDCTPGDRQRGRQVGLLGQQVGGPVSHPPRLAQQHLGAVAHDVEQHVLVLGEPRQPRLHAVEHEALRQPFPLLATPGLEPDEPVGALAHLGCGEQLAAREDGGVGEVGQRTLVRDRELGEPVDLIAPQVDAHRPVGGRREHVDDRAPHRHLAAVLDHVLSAVADGHQVGHQLVAVELLTRAHDDRLGVFGVRAEALHQRADRGHDDSGQPRGIA
jgi:hypothetical protein